MVETKRKTTVNNCTARGEIFFMSRSYTTEEKATITKLFDLVRGEDNNACVAAFKNPNNIKLFTEFSNYISASMFLHYTLTIY